MVKDNRPKIMGHHAGFKVFINNTRYLILRGGIGNNHWFGIGTTIRTEDIDGKKVKIARTFAVTPACRTPRGVVDYFEKK